MKKLIIAFSLILSSISLFAQEEGIDFFHGTFDEAKALAAEEDKLIFMDAYATWCGPCKRMAANTFPLKNVGDFFNRNFINLKMDMEKGEGKDIAKMYGVGSYPTLLFLDSEGNVVHQAKGARDENGLISLGKKALLPNQAMVDELQAKWDNGDRDVSFLKSWIKVQSVLGEEYDEAMTSFTEQLSAADKISDDNVDFIFEQANHTKSPALAIVYEYEDYYKDYFGEETYNDRMQKIASSTLTKAVLDKDEATLAEAIDMLKTLKADDYKEQMALYEVTYYGKTKNWDAYSEVVSKYLKKYKKDDDEALRRVAWNYYMYVSDTDKLQEAEKWTTEAIALNNSYENNLTQAYIYYKLEKYSDAQDAIEYALILAGESQKRTDNAQILYDKIYSKLEEQKAE